MDRRPCCKVDYSFFFNSTVLLLASVPGGPYDPLKEFHLETEMVPFLLSKVFLHQTLCNHDYCILVYAIHQELIKSMNQKVMRNHFIRRYSLFHPKSALHISCLLFHIGEGKSVKILWLLWAFKISVLLHQRGKKAILNIALWKKLCKTGKWKQDFSMASTQHEIRIWKDICMEHIHCTAMLPKIWIHRQDILWHTCSECCELPLDARLFGHILVQKTAAKLSNLQQNELY